MSLIASMLMNAFPDWILCGFYRKVGEEMLEIGPLQAPLSPVTKFIFQVGVRGKAASTCETVIAENVRTFLGYISCR